MDTQVADLLGGARVLGASVKSNLDLARATRQGLPAETAVQLVEAIRGSDVVAEGPSKRRLGRVPKKTVAQEPEVEAIGLTAMGPLGDVIGSLPNRVSRRKAGQARATASTE